MKKQLIQLAAVSIAGHVATGYVIFAQHQTILRYKHGYGQLLAWSNLTQEIIARHYDNGGELIVGQDLIDKLNAFEIFVNNDIV